MHLYLTQALAAERARDWQQQAARSRRARQARRAAYPMPAAGGHAGRDRRTPMPAAGGRAGHLT